jgi:hypothetical protein
MEMDLANPYHDLPAPTNGRAQRSETPNTKRQRMERENAASVAVPVHLPNRTQMRDLIQADIQESGSALEDILAVLSTLLSESSSPAAASITEWIKEECSKSDF